jgi:tetratricopeptide (TPR) repeat protein
VGVLTRVWERIRRPRRAVSSVELLQRAERCRREGRFEDGAALVREVVAREPKNPLALLLGGYLHAALRNSAAARAAFRAVLALDPEHPRAMLGLARIAFENGEPGPARELLEKALRIYPDFPEALALLDVARAVAGEAAPASDAAASGTVMARLAQVARPEGTRECLLLTTDGGLLLAHPATATRDALAAHLARVASLGSATLARAGLGPLRRASVSANPGTTFIAVEGGHVLALTLPPEATVAAGQSQTAELWKRLATEVGA